MPRYAEKRHLPYTQTQLFDLVADIERYPEFLPWCVGARIREQRGVEIDADLVIGFKIYRERFTSHVKLSRPGEIHVRYSDGPFKYLRNEWRFETDAGGGTTIDFFVDFEFRSRLLQHVVELFFTEAVRRMVGAFEQRAKALYGRPAERSNTAIA